MRSGQTRVGTHGQNSPSPLQALPVRIGITPTKEAPCPPAAPARSAQSWLPASPAARAGETATAPGVGENATERMPDRTLQDIIVLATRRRELTMPDSETRPQSRPPSLTTGALLTWVAGGFITVLGGALLIATLTGRTALALAFAGIVGLAGTSTTSPHPAIGAVLMAVGVLPSLLALAAFQRSRGALTGLAVAAGAYVLLTTVLVLGPETGLTSTMLSLFGVFWVAVSVSLFWSQQNWYQARDTDRKSTRLNSSHVSISYAVFCLK